ncbi:unnamed protein product, partial [Cylicostephanus goldi]
MNRCWAQYETQTSGYGTNNPYEVQKVAKQSPQTRTADYTSYKAPRSGRKPNFQKEEQAKTTKETQNFTMNSSRFGNGSATTAQPNNQANAGSETSFNAVNPPGVFAGAPIFIPNLNNLFQGNLLLPSFQQVNQQESGNHIQHQAQPPSYQAPRPDPTYEDGQSNYDNQQPGPVTSAYSRPTSYSTPPSTAATFPTLMTMKLPLLLSLVALSLQDYALPPSGYGNNPAQVQNIAINAPATIPPVSAGSMGFGGGFGP